MAVITQVDELQEIQELEAIPVIDPVTEVLHKTADLLEKDGWIQCADCGPNGSRCVVRAIASVTAYNYMVPFRRQDTQLLEAAVNRLSRQIGSENSPTHVAGWNDVEGRTKEEVITALRSA